MKNLDIRITVADKGLTYRQIAEVMGVTPVYLSRIMAKELKPSMRTRILNAIDELEQVAEKKGQ
ncbi:MAG: helix-turn-helix transcriptional regulator [Acetatifactor sp.]|nr:helix-turn-helix transcriptional regulator [Acetatifactor sp.]